MEAVGVPPAAPIVEGFTLHGGHVEEIAGYEGTAESLFFMKPADLWNLWDFEAGFMALLIALEVVGITQAASIVEFLALLGNGVVVIALDFCSARSFVHLKKTRAFS